MQAFLDASRRKNDSSTDKDIDLSRSALMSENPLDMKSKKAIQIVHKLMTRAINEGREEEMIQKIAARITKIKNWAAQDAGHIKAAREMDKLTKSPTLRVHNFNQLAKGAKNIVLLSDHTGTNADERQKEIDKAAECAERGGRRFVAVSASPVLN